MTVFLRDSIPFSLCWNGLVYQKKTLTYPSRLILKIPLWDSFESTQNWQLFLFLLVLGLV